MSGAVQPVPEPWATAAFRLLLRVLALLALAYVLWRLGGIIVVVLVSVLLAFTLAPAVDRLCRTRLFRILPRQPRRILASALVFAVVAAALVQVCMMVVQPLGNELTQLRANWPGYQRQLNEWMQSARAWWESVPPEIRTGLEGFDWGRLVENAGEQSRHLLLRTLESGMLVVELILIPVLAFSFLTESRPLKRELALLVPRRRLRDWLWALRRCGGILQSYAIGQLILALIAGGVVYFLLTGMGIHYALAMSVVAAVTRLIPVIGPVIGAIPILTLCALQGPDRALIVLIAFTGMHLVESKVIMPRIIGHRIDLHPAVVIVVLLIGAEFFGMWGMFLAAPVVAIARSLILRFCVEPRTGRRRPPAPEAAVSPVKEGSEVEHPAIAGARSRSGAH